MPGNIHQDNDFQLKFFPGKTSHDFHETAMKNQGLWHTAGQLVCT